MSDPVDEAVRKLALRLAQEEWPTMKDSHDEDAKLFERVLTEQLAPLLLRVEKIIAVRGPCTDRNTNMEEHSSERCMWCRLRAAWAKLTGRTP